MKREEKKNIDKRVYFDQVQTWKSALASQMP